jgi:cytochrome P450
LLLASAARTVDLDHPPDPDLGGLAFWQLPLAEREETFRRLRATPQPQYFPEYSSAYIAGYPPEFETSRGFFALVHHAQIVEVSRRPEDFSSDRGSAMGDNADTVSKFVGGMISMDDPEHARLRRIVSKGFTPKQLAAVRESAERLAHELVVEMAPKGEGDFVADVAALLPLRVIMEMLAIPRSQEEFVLHCTNSLLGGDDPEFAFDPNAVDNPAVALAGIVGEVAAARLAEPTDDVMSMLVHADVDGEHLTPFELASFFLLLVQAGSETTRNAVAHGLYALTEHPDQRDIWQADVLGAEPTAIEEIIRWSSPLIHMRRTVTHDGVRVGDFVFDEGDKVILFYASANRDEAVFDDPQRFDVRRSPNEHIAFGGPGPHFCLGAHLARREIGVMFEELFTHVPDIHSVGEPDRLLSNFIHGAKRLQAEWTPTSVAPGLRA